MPFSPLAVGVAAAVVLVASACGGGGSGYGGGGTPTTPTAPPAAGQGTVTIVGDRGAQSFSPNPGTGNTDQMVTWRNNDTVTHRIMVNDTTLDTGDIAPGATSRAIQLPAAGANYHCSIHPGMIGAIQGSGGTQPPPCTGAYC